MAKPWVRLVLALAALSVSSGLSAQTSQQAAPKPSAGPAPLRDLSGVWNAAPPPSIRKFIGNTWTQDQPEMTPWGEMKFKEAKSSNGGEYTLDQTNDPVITRCYPPGTPRIYMQPFPFQIVQTPTQVIMIYEYDHTVRFINLNEPLPKDPDPTYMGTSVGHWDNDTTLVVDTVGFNDKTWLDRVGHPHSDQLHVTEKFRRVDKDHIQIDVTMDDPKAYVKPWSQTISYRLHTDWHIMEQVCADNASFANFEKAEGKSGSK